MEGYADAQRIDIEAVEASETRQDEIEWMRERTIRHSDGGTGDRAQVFMTKTFVCAV